MSKPAELKVENSAQTSFRFSPIRYCPLRTKSMAYMGCFFAMTVSYTHKVFYKMGPSLRQIVHVSFIRVRVSEIARAWRGVAVGGWARECSSYLEGRVSNSFWFKIKFDKMENENLRCF